jgi:fluoride exporter
MGMLNNIILVAIGGAFGAVARYVVLISPLKSLSNHFPFPTFSVNIIGSFFIGLGMIYFTDRTEANEALRLALFSGFLGSFTTFSAFQFEIYELIRDGSHMSAFVYASASLVIGLIGLFLGVILGKAI